MKTAHRGREGVFCLLPRLCLPCSSFAAPVHAFGVGRGYGKISEVTIKSKRVLASSKPRDAIHSATRGQEPSRVGSKAGESNLTVETAHNKLCARARCSQVYKRKNRDLRVDSRPASKRKIENRTQKPRARRDQCKWRAEGGEADRRRTEQLAGEQE